MWLEDMLSGIKMSKVFIAALAVLTSVSCGSDAIAPAGTAYPATFSEPEPNVADQQANVAPTPTPSPVVSPTPGVTPIPTPKPTPTPTPTPVATPTPTPTPTPVATPTPTPTPTPLPTPTPTPTPTPGANSGSGTLNGFVGVSTFTPQSATWTLEGTQLVVYLWQSANACTKWSQAQEPSGGYLRMTMGDVAQGYAVGAGGATATFDVLSATCQGTIPAVIGDANSGSVILTTAPASAAATGDAVGTYTLVFGLQVVTGSFNAAPCAALASAPTSLTCSP